MLHMQIDAFGPDDYRVFATRKKVAMLESKQQQQLEERTEKKEDPPLGANEGKRKGKFRPFRSSRSRNYMSMP